jgi:hypothetical protein
MACKYSVKCTWRARSRRRARNDRTAGDGNTLLSHGGPSRCAAETMLKRLCQAFGLGPHDQVNPRVAAVHSWKEGRVSESHFFRERIALPPA